MIDYTDLDPNKPRTSVYNEFGTTTKEGNKLFHRLQKKIKPIIHELCEEYKPNEVMTIAQSIVGMEAMNYAASLVHIHRKQLKEEASNPARF